MMLKNSKIFKWITYVTSTLNPPLESMSCHHRLTKNPIELTYPQCNYYNLEMENTCFLQIDFKQFYTVCPYDFLQVGPSHRICGLAKSGTTQLVPINSNSIQISLVRTNPNSFDQYELMVKPIFVPQIVHCQL